MWEAIKDRIREKILKMTAAFRRKKNEFDSAVKLSLTKRRYTNSFSMHKKVDIKLPTVYINYHVFIYRKVDIRLRKKSLSSRIHQTKNDINLQREYINTCSSAGKLKKRCNMYILQRVHLKENWYKVAVCIYHHMFVCRKVGIKLRYLYIINSSSAVKLI